MLGVQEALGPFQVQVVFGKAVPGKRDEIIQIIEADGVLRHRRVGLFNPLQLLQGYGQHLRGQLGLVDSGAQIHQVLAGPGPLFFAFTEKDHGCKPFYKLVPNPYC